MIGHFYFESWNDQFILTNDTGAFCFLEKNDFDDFIHGRLTSEHPKYIELEKKLFHYEKSQEAYIRQAEEAIRKGNRYLFEPTNLFIFALTNACNNQCLYCQANGQSRVKSMTPEVAEQALNQIAQCPAYRITIEFQGGEPLLNDKLIRYIVQRAETILAHKDVQFALVSNLSLLTEEMASFLVDHHVSVSTSLDGPAIIHDLNRPSANGKSSLKAMLRGKALLEKKGISVGAIETTTAFSLPYPEKIVDTYIEYGFSQIFLRPLTRLGAASLRWDTIGYAAERFVDFYKKSLQWIIKRNIEGNRLIEYHASLFLKKMFHGQAVNYMELRSPCGAGLGQMAITANGNVYTCDEGRMMAEMGDEAFLIGNVFEGNYNTWIQAMPCKAVCSASLLDTLPGCCDCINKPYCGVCPVINFAINGNLTQKSKDRCIIYKGILTSLLEYIYEGNPQIIAILNEWSEQA